MAYLKYIKGHTDCYHVWKYLRYNKDTNKLRTLRTKYYGLWECDNQLQPEKSQPWYKIMDRDRKQVGTNDPRPPHKKSLKYLHFILSPDPRDNVTIDELEEFCDEWLERAFQVEEGFSKFSVAVEFHNDNGILHAHLIMNNVDWKPENINRLRFTNYIKKKQLNYAWQLRQQMAKERGWHSFLQEEMETVEKTKQLSEGHKFNGSISQETKDLFEYDEKFFHDNPKYNSNLKYEPPYSKNIYGQIVMTKEGAYYDRKEKEILAREGTSIKEEIRKCIEIGLNVCNNYQDFLKVLEAFGVEYEYTQNNDLKFRHPRLSNVMFRGYRLGKNYTRQYIENYFNEKYDKATETLKPIKAKKDKNDDDLWKEQLGIKIYNDEKKQNQDTLASLGAILTNKDASLNIYRINASVFIANNYNAWDSNIFKQTLNSKEKEINKNVEPQMQCILNNNLNAPSVILKNLQTELNRINLKKDDEIKWNISGMTIDEIGENLKRYYHDMGYDKKVVRTKKKKKPQVQNQQKRSQQQRQNTQQNKNKTRNYER